MTEIVDRVLTDDDREFVELWMRLGPDSRAVMRVLLAAGLPAQQEEGEFERLFNLAMQRNPRNAREADAVVAEWRRGLLEVNIIERGDG